MGYLCATCGGVGGLFESSHAHSDKDSCIAELKASNAKLRAEVERLTKEDREVVWMEQIADLQKSLSEVVKERDAALLQVSEARKAFEEIYKNEGPGLDGSSENASGRIARLALERLTEKQKGDHCYEAPGCSIPYHPCLCGCDGCKPTEKPKADTEVERVCVVCELAKPLNVSLLCSGCYEIMVAKKRKCGCSCHPTNSQDQQCGACNGNHD